MTRPDKRNSAKLPLVSVIITTKNEEKNIENCLNSIISQTYPRPKIEIIVIDNHSTDKTKEISRQFTNKVFQNGPERSAQRNYGMLNIAKGDYLIYLDADMVLSPQVVSSCINRVKKDSSIVGLYISEIVSGNGFWSRVRRFERSFYDATVVDCVRFVRSEDVRAVKGFDTHMTGPEDWDFDKKIRQRGKVGLIREPIFHNESDFKLSKYLLKKNYYANSFSTYIKKWGSNDPEVKKQFGFYYRYFGVFIENGKWKRNITRPVLSVGMFFLRFSVGLIYVYNNLRSKFK